MTEDMQNYDTIGLETDRQSTKPVNPRCLLHTDILQDYTNATIKPFNQQTWTKVQIAATTRKSWPNCFSSKYICVIENLPVTCPTKDGYHPKCYSNFTALSKPKSIQHRVAESGDAPITPCSPPLLRSCVPSTTVTSTGVFGNTCIFCEKERKKRKGEELKLVQCEYDDPESNVVQAAKIMKDSVMLAKVGSVDFQCKRVKYHHSCKTSYFNKARAYKDQTEKGTEFKEGKERVWSQVCEYTENTIISNNLPQYLVTLHHQYLQYCEEEERTTNMTFPYTTPRRFADKLKEHFGKKISIAKSSRKQGLVVFSSILSVQEALKMMDISSQEAMVESAAKVLRSTILQLKETATKPSTPLTLEYIKNGEMESPNILRNFFEILCSDTTRPGRPMAQRTRRQVESFCSDVIYAVTNGEVKPAKHLCMGLGLKSLTGQRKVVELLNHLGHSIGYHLTEELETKLAEDICQRNTAIPDGLLAQNGLSTALAWDNFDELIETLSGKNTLHDTMGICYQSRPDSLKKPNSCIDNPAHDVAEETTHSEHPQGRKMKRRSFDPPSRDIAPYRRKPKASTFFYTITTTPLPANLMLVNRSDQLWMMLCALKESVPMWRGWNSLVTDDPLPLQAIGYMENIELPPTRHDVVQETMVISQKVAEECGEKVAVVTYDLAIAKPALQIQATEMPRFDNLFICFGAFHINMTYFACLGYLLDGSGGPEILGDCDILAQGSLAGFLSGKHFNRCKRLHPLLATAIQILHFKRFVQVFYPNGLPADFTQLLSLICEEPSPITLSRLETSQSYISMMVEYEEFTQATRQGVHGTTAQFWIIYVDLLHQYLLFDRACRTNDVDLFIYALGEMCPIFFSVNRPNYARWMVRYHLNLMNMNEDVDE